jgi:uncharacterized protein involved in type VI secretion and phage assembly
MQEDDLTRHAGKYYGKYAGFVAKDSKPDARGRIKVVVPTIYGETTSVWAQPCLPWGHFTMPPPAAKIWVEFEAGDPDFPLWVGTYYPDGTAPAEAQAQPQTHRVIQMPSGHTIELSDEEGAEKIVIRHKDNAFVALEADGSVIVSNKQGANLFMNAKGGETTLMGEQGHLVTMSKDAMSLINKEGTVVELKGDTATVLAGNVSISGTSVALGAQAMEPTILGTAFTQLWTLVMTHTHPTAMGPSGPPTPPILPLQPGVHLTSSVVVK